MDGNPKLNERLRRMVTKPAPSPWRRMVHAVGGLTEVGYVSDSDLLIVVSSTGRGLFDCATGEKIARDNTQIDEGDWYDETGLLTKGIGPVEQQSIHLAGLHGGGLRKFARDGWSVEMIAPDWPIQCIVIQPPGGCVYIERFADGCQKIEEDYELRAFGFSETGRSLVVASSSSLVIYSRA